MTRAADGADGIEFAVCITVHRSINKANPKKQSGLAARLEAMQKQAEEMRKLREQQQKR